MTEYLKRLDAGEDSRTLILEMSQELEERDKIFTKIVDMVSEQNNPQEVLCVDIISEIPAKCILNQTS